MHRLATTQQCDRSARYLVMLGIQFKSVITISKGLKVRSRVSCLPQNWFVCMEFEIYSPTPQSVVLWFEIDLVDFIISKIKCQQKQYIYIVKILTIMIKKYTVNVRQKFTIHWKLQNRILIMLNLLSYYLKRFDLPSFNRLKFLLLPEGPPPD